MSAWLSISLCFDGDIRVEVGKYGVSITDRDGGSHEVPEWVGREMRSLYLLMDDGQLVRYLARELLKMREPPPPKEDDR